MIKEFIKELIKSILFALGIFAVGILTLFLTGIYHETYGAEINVYEEVFSNATEEDFDALEEVVYWESVGAGCDFEVNVAVIETVCNRVLNKQWPNTIKEVCYQKGQFYRKAVPDGLDEIVYQDLSDAIEYVYHNGQTMLPDTHYCYFATLKQSYAESHVWVGARRYGKPVKSLGMYFGREKRN